MSDLISRQAAIDALSCENPTETYIYYDDAVKAIKELPPAEPETHEKRTKTHSCDLISRKDAIRIVDSIDTWQAGWRGNAIESLKAMPSAERTGRWINVNEGKWNTISVFKCSACGEIDSRIYQSDNFCPNCGCRMMEVEHD